METEKSFDKVQYSFIIKTHNKVNKVGIEEICQDNEDHM